jgi:hypothetical protein
MSAAATAVFLAMILQKWEMDDDEEEEEINFNEQLVW